MKDYRKLKVWKKSHELVLKIYEITSNYPKSEMYGLVSQIRRASISIPANIAEGCGRSGDMELNRFLFISFGSACELEYLLLLSKDLNIINLPIYNEINESVGEIKKMLSTLIKTVKASN